MIASRLSPLLLLLIPVVGWPLSVHAEARVELRDAGFARDRDGGERVERVAVGTRVFWFVQLANTGDRPAAVAVELWREGRRIDRMRFRRGNRIPPGGGVRKGKPLPAMETATAGRRCYEARLRPLGRGSVTVSGTPRTLCLDVTTGDGTAGDGGVPPPGGTGAVGGAVLALREVAFVGEPDCWGLLDGGQVCHVRLEGRLANVGDMPTGPVVLELYAPVRGRAVIPRRDGDLRRTVAALAAGAETTVTFRLVFYESGRQCAGIRIAEWPPDARIAETEGFAPVDATPARRSACVRLPGIRRPRPSPPRPTARPWTVELEVTAIEVLDDGDNLSPGDWWVAVAVAPEDGPFLAGDAWSGVRDVSTGDTIRTPGLRMEVPNFDGRRALVMAAQVVDCDGGWSVGVDRHAVLGAPGIERVPDCRFEEEMIPPEATGAADVGFGRRLLAPAEWRNGGDFALTVREEGASDPLEARIHFRIRARPAVREGASFRAPTLEGLAVDACREWGRNCGRPAADAFCRALGYAEADGYRIDHDRPPTVTVGDRRICTRGFCDRLVDVTCIR